MSSRTNNRQESFFFMDPSRAAGNVRPPFDPKELYRLAAQGVFLGTSSWKYRGWEGLIYQGGYASEAQFQRASLREYTLAFPCVGVEFTYYAWPMPEMMAYLVDSTPENFRLCPKVTKRITLSSFPDLPAYGKWAGKKNPDYLNPELYRTQFHDPVQKLQGRLGVVLFEFSGPEEEDLKAFEKFFREIPRDFTYGVEIRNPALVRPSFYALLRELNVAPAFSHWTRMPTIMDQWKAQQEAGPLAESLPYIGMGLLREGRSYEEAVRMFQPYKEVQDENSRARQELAFLGLAALGENRKAYLLVNNRLEGSAPHTVGAVAQLISARPQ